MHVATRLVLLKEPAYTLSPLADEKVANKPVVGLKVKAKGYGDLDLFFDKASGLLAKMRYERIDESGKKITEEMLVKEYQKVDGIFVPKRIGVNHNGKEVQEVEYTEFKLLPTMDEKEFEVKPPSR